MDEMKKQRIGLGRGLSALFGESAASDEDQQVDRVRLTRLLPIDQVHPGRYQPRRQFLEDDLAALVESVRERGILQPLLVRKDQVVLPGPPRYEIIAGERRWRAAQLAGLHEVPVLVRNLSDREALEVALIENIQRADLTPIEEAEGYRRLMNEFSHTQEDLARSVGKSRSHVANMLRLLALPESIKQMVHDGRLSMGHARALLAVEQPEPYAEQALRQGLNVRQMEMLVKRPLTDTPDADETAPVPTPIGKGKGKRKSIDTSALEKELSQALGLKVTLASKADQGVMQIHYQTLDQLDGVLNRILRR
jgi:ParB family transcriptional regulator, chromosome partitioning protein